MWLLTVIAFHEQSVIMEAWVWIFIPFMLQRAWENLTSYIFKAWTRLSFLIKFRWKTNNYDFIWPDNIFVTCLKKVSMCNSTFCYTFHYHKSAMKWSTLSRYNDNGLNLELEMILLSYNNWFSCTCTIVSTKNYFVCIELEYKFFLLLGVMKGERIIRLILKSACILLIRMTFGLFTALISWKKNSDINKIFIK